MANRIASPPEDLARDRDQVPDHARMLALTVRIVAAHIAHNPIASPELPSLIHTVYSGLARARAGVSGTVGPTGLVPAVPIERSVFPDYIVCLENGRHFRTLRRHLLVSFSLTPEQYRRRWGLPYDYPMIAPSYARNRSGVAKATGLGRNQRHSARNVPADGQGSA